MEAEHMPVIYKVEWNFERGRFIFVEVERYSYGLLRTDTSLHIQGHSLQARASTTRVSDSLEADDVIAQQGNWHFATTDTSQELKRILHGIYTDFMDGSEPEAVAKCVKNTLDTLEAGVFN